MEQSANAIEGQKNCLEFPHEELEKDKISALPDEFLTPIISQLTTREATATSILSTRWRHLYAYVDRAEFLPLELELGQETNHQTILHQTILSNFSDMITHTIDSHKAVSIKEFKLHVPCPEAATDGIIDRLLKFALSKKVEKMDISAHVANSDFRVWDSVRASSMDDDRVSFPHLKELALSGVPVGDDEVAFLLANSPLLECLSISGSIRLESVSIVGLKLKRFHISNSDVLKSVEVVDALDLVTLRCYKIRSSGFKIKVKLNNLPMLTELGISEAYRNPIFQTLSYIPPCVLEGIRTFRVWTPPPDIWCFTKLPNMTNVRHLEIVVGQIAGHDRPFPLFRLIESCDLLETLDIKLLRQPKDPYIEKFRERRVVFRAPLEHLSPNIKKLKVSGYAGSPEESEIVLFVVKNVSSLEEFVVELFDQTPRLRRRAEHCARKYFRRIAPNFIDVTIV